MRPYFFLTLAPLLWAGNILEGRLPRPERRLWLTLAAIALTGVLLFNVLVYLSLEYTTSTNAALILGAAPILTMILAAAFGSEELTPCGLTGALVCLIGIAWIIYQGSVDALLNVSFNLGDIIMMVAVVCWAIYTALIRSTRQLSQLATTTIAALLAVSLLGVVGGYQLATQPLGPISDGYLWSRLRGYLGLGGGLHGLGQRHQQHRRSPRFTRSESHSGLHPHTCLACVGRASRIGTDRRGLIGDLWRDAGIVRGVEAH
jgi:drug/metabolite transporter (DMT)-like permease